MLCPVCGRNMVEEDFGGVKVDSCKNGCKGMWFDWQELRKLDENNEGFGNALQKALNHPRTNDENRGKITCPKCGLPMRSHKYKSAKEVNVDECYACGGFFLDSGELQTIRDNFMSGKEEAQYLNALLGNMPDYSKLREDTAKKKARAAALRKYTRFIRLSYYATGK